MLYALQILTINYSDRGDGTYPIYSTSNGRNSGRLGGERIEQLLRRVVQQYRKSAVGCEYYVLCQTVNVPAFIAKKIQQQPQSSVGASICCGPCDKCPSVKRQHIRIVHLTKSLIKMVQ